jgi:hypothetical protein
MMDFKIQLQRQMLSALTKGREVKWIGNTKDTTVVQRLAEHTNMPVVILVGMVLNGLLIIRASLKLLFVLTASNQCVTLYST